MLQEIMQELIHNCEEKKKFKEKAESSISPNTINLERIVCDHKLQNDKMVAHTRIEGGYDGDT